MNYFVKIFRFIFQCNRKRFFKISIMMIGCSIGLTGCRSLVVNPQSGGEALPFSQLLLRQEQDAQSLLQNHLPLQLSQAILWAKERNHRLLRQKIRQELSHIQKQAALEPFLPNIQVQWSRQGFRKDPLILMNGIPIMTQDRYVNEWIYQVQQAIFAPQAYYAYRLRSHQEELEKVLYEIQERGIVVGVIQSYVILWSLTNQIQMVEKEIHYLSQLLQDTQVAEKVGIRLPLDTQLVHYQIQSKQYEHQQLRREYEVACGELLELLGFPATPSLIAQIQIAPFSDQETSQFHNSLPSKDEGILTALKHRLEINISDLYLQQAEDQIRLALSEFLPTLGVQAVYTRSTNSFLKYADNMLLGVGAFLSVFQGFRSIQDYRAALRVRHETMVLREVQCLAIILEFLRAYNLYERAIEQYNLALSANEIAQENLRLRQIEWENQMIPLSTYLMAKEQADIAKLFLQTTLYVRYFSQVFLFYSMGIYPQKEVPVLQATSVKKAL